MPETDVDRDYTQAKNGATDEAFQQELTVQKVLEKEITDKVTVSDQEVTDFFNANKAQFNLPEDAVHIAQIVVTPGADAQVTNGSGDDATTPQAAQEEVTTLTQRLQAGTPFGDLARDYSEDPESAPRGGDMGLVPVSAIRQAPKALRDAVLSMQPGVAHVVNDGSVFRIMLLVSKEPAGQRDLTTPGTKEQITQAIKSRREQLLRDAYLRALRTDADITNYIARRVVEGNGKP